MNQTVLKGFELEISESPRLSGFGEPAEVQPPNRPALFVVYASARGSSTGATPRTLLHACILMRDVLDQPQKAPGWLTVVDEVHFSTTLERKWSRIRADVLFVGGLRRHEDRFDYDVVFYSKKNLQRWSAAEKSTFHDELEQTISFLTELTPYPAKPEEPPKDTDSDRQLQLARERREQLLREESWFDAPTVHVQQGNNPQSQGINSTASRLRRRQELLGVWNGREYLHATFQFDPQTGRLMPQMKDLLAVLPQDRSGWRQAFWLYQRHRQLDGARPADVFQKDPLAVIKAARSDFETSDEHW